MKYFDRNMFLIKSLTLTACLLILTVAGISRAADIDSEPIKYTESKPSNCITQLQMQLNQGQLKFEFDTEFGYLPSLLKSLNVPKSSQALVFSKTSFQRQRIAPRTPRALYFNDQVYIGYCHNGDVLEISAVDPVLGAVFYSLDQEQSDRPVFQRHIDTCLICHSSTHTHNVPGHMVRSVYPDAGGYPILASGTYRTDHTSPFKQRWGGWYVSGTHGKQSHLGNLIIRSTAKDAAENADNSAGQNLTSLTGLFRTSSYLTPHSDIVALMVLEHQVAAHNYITRANFETRAALFYEEGLNRELKQPAGHRWDSTRSRIKSVGEALVKYLLFSGETELTERVTGVSGFAEEFTTHGPRDSHGRSLREFDLERRLFRYPCSYLIYSEAFEALHPDMKSYVYQRLYDVLTNVDTAPEFKHLRPEDRLAVLQILRETKPHLPDYWHEKAPKE